jgi:uncharacterized RDD family membrane protein YckC
VTEAAREILTPEHVRIRLAPAGLGARFWAWLLDQFLVLGTASLLWMLLAVFLPAGIALAAAWTFYFFGGLAYMAYGEVRWAGQTLGKKVAGIRVVDGRGLPMALQQSFIRNIARVLDAAPVGYAVGALVCLLDPHGRRAGDLAADTLVITEARPLEYRGQTLSPRRFNTLRTPRVLGLIRHRISLEEREFLLALCLRADRLAPQTRYDLMEEVGAHYRAKLQVEDPHLSNENLVLDLTAVLYGDK